MKLLFVDMSTRAYTTRTGATEPLGGTQGAVAGLSAALAADGHSVTVVNGVEVVTEVDGVRFQSLHDAVVLNEYDFVVSVSCAMGERLREMGCGKPIILWSHHNANQPAIMALQSPAERAAWNGFALVSEWQVDRYREVFTLNPAKVGVMRNAVGDAFLSSDSKKTGAPVLVYSSTPYRGLDILLMAWPLIRKEIPDARLNIFSSMDIYGGEPDPYHALYEMGRALDGVVYHGAVSQTRLAVELSCSDVWAYPCTFEETSCVSAMEAMASGCLLVSTDLGALRETLGDYGNLMAVNTRGDIAPILAGKYAAYLIEAWENRKDTKEQIDYVRGMTWAVRAKEWVEWLNKL